MTFAISLLGGEANGSWFEGHALPAPPPAYVDVAIGGANGPALLDLPDDEPEPGERRVRYERVAVGHLCRVRGRGCVAYATYRREGLDWSNGKFRRDLLADAGVTPRLEVVDG